MNVAPDPAALVAHLIAQGREWVTAQRSAHRPLAQGIPSRVQNVFRPFFGDVVGRARYSFVPKIENPPFLLELQRAGVAGIFDFSTMDGITFQDTFLITQAAPQDNLASLLFHELVHVVQYDVLGLDEFVAEYVTGWAGTGRSYETIPLEVMAFDLQHRFEAAPQAAFSVLDEVVRRFVRR